MPKIHLVNFGVGALAGLTAALFPKLLPILVGSNPHAELVWFTERFLAASLLFAVLVGAVVAVLESDRPRPARQTFQTALGIPALLAGALNTGMVANDLGRDVTRLQNALESSAGITIEEVGRRLPDEADAVRPAGLVAAPALRVAQYGVESAARYYVVLGRAETEDGARELAARIAEGHGNVATHVVALPGGGFAVTTTARPQGRTDALVEGADLKRRTDLTPDVIRLR